MSVVPERLNGWRPAARQAPNQIAGCSLHCRGATSRWGRSGGIRGSRHQNPATSPPLVRRAPFPGHFPWHSDGPSTRPRRMSTYSGPHLTRLPSGSGLGASRTGAGRTGPFAALSAMRCGSTGWRPGNRSSAGRLRLSAPSRLPRTTSSSDGCLALHGSPFRRARRTAPVLAMKRRPSTACPRTSVAVLNGHFV